MPSLPIKLPAQEMFDQLQKYNQKVFHATGERDWAAFGVAKNDLRNWFLAHGIELIENEEN